MDYEQPANEPTPSEPVGTPTPAAPPFTPPPPVPVFQSPVYQPQPKKRGLWAILSTILLVLSILANGFFLMAIIGMGMMMSLSKVSDNVTEKVLIDGNKQEKITAIRIDGIIDAEMSDWVSAQLEAAEQDMAVKGIIIRIISPGGGVSASDQIHRAITRYKERTGQPVLAFMQSIAASGGYYSAVACDEIMAEPTTITGSIGVMINHLVIKDLLEQKLGIIPVTLKSGLRKDWPSMFSETTDEQKQYLDEKVIQPAYERFISLVLEGRKEKLNEEQVRKLADGSIFSAPEAVENKLIDQVGYFEEAVAAINKKAGVGNPTVVEYEQKISFMSMLEAQSQTGLRIDKTALEKLLIPQLMYIWDGQR